jgi:hypothetical protein
MFDWLFNYSLDTWQGARLALSHNLPVWLIVLAAIMGAIAIVVSLTRLPLSVAHRTIIGCIQLALLAVVCLMLLQPTLLVEEVRRDENAVAVLLDSSTSMNFPAANGPAADPSLTRVRAAADAFSPVADELLETFDVQLFDFSTQLNAQSDYQNVMGSGSITDLAGALTELLDQSSADALASVIVLSDGSNNSTAMDIDWWNRIRLANVPIHTVAVGPERMSNDVEIADVQLPDIALPDASIEARVTLIHPANSGQVRLRVRSGNELRVAEDVLLQANALQTVHQFSLPTGSEGLQGLTFDIETSAEDSNTVNNVTQRVLNVAPEPRRVLYVEGEPRWEYKFLRRALDQQKDVEVVSLLRTSPNKFYRQGVASPRELETGFPLTRAALFGYDAVIIGSLEAAELSVEQQANLRDYVAERGGALLMLGGSRGLADGGWGRSALHAVLPVSLQVGTGLQDITTFQRKRASVELTEFGRRAHWLTLPAASDAPSFDGEGSADSLLSSQAAWSSLPALANVQRVGQPRAGAQVLLQTQATAQPVLVWQRYGKGRSYVLATSGTWRWQMSLPSEDQRHEVFWQNVMAELVRGVPDRVRVNAGPMVQRDQSSAVIEVVAFDEEFNALVQNELQATLTQPDGQVQTVRLVPDLNRPAYFVGSVSYDQPGAYALEVTLPSDDTALEYDVHQNQGIGAARWMVERGTAEYFNAGANSALLKRLAEETNGTYRTLATLDELPLAVSSFNNALTRQNELPLWNMPILFLLLVLGKALEWALRLKWKRL